ncbi:hypothetical protein COT20_01920 [bacterium (Candidatus Gribaldobacteria) CG08_land_8_20_14_0_20_39_15]|uniref:Uncharacterized protein n=1 Tax=bacterium (Candidatus Gribaldobacteria) CG08_land_8_20_14_0_20_39_15 TaxID=2014273 RepID=A0A2M6XUB8_9BACT|nr:MAG: hypothetical protein COT20_01920 [bacterium (Candidatus Gribaldobacteria) CG08_land_8_20_14_0_20_39_15]
MKSQKILLILIIFLFFNIFFCLAAAQNSDNFSEAEGLPSVVEIKPVSSLFQDVKEFFIDKVRKITSFNLGEGIEKIKTWSLQRKEGIYQGWQEEKKEFQEILQKSFSQIIFGLWQKIFGKK